MSSSEVNAESAAAVRRTTRLALRALECAPACCGATVTLRVPECGRRTTATHPDLAVLAELRDSGGEGPDADAFASREPVACVDLLADTRWPRFRARALEAGIRACLTVPVHQHGMATAVTLYAFRPGALSPALQHPVRVLAEEFVEGLLREHACTSARVEVQQLRKAITSRAVIDRACGIVMRVVGCGADEAFTILRAISQGTNQKMGEIAAEVVDGNGRGLVQHLRRIRHTVPTLRGGGTSGR
ncbi:ANTAR domain-containing response regulator [Streptomyces fulvorobeus]|uniref:AmiR/NasT family two-component response regulator n=1 Tax=Streptomyces fulvorobeus TaxID=284028 RepID=A0A7J0CEF9_9ACTN|nr:GAF and ANTAR domain-containing protein [Streptomyces fulvorobeus]NYE44368.1 AmiR/NasT family two-component response regulator [Streptomyces fulvorobeus]GFN00893.1 transcriptional regulator [Streptomyces fulvorobeus]